MYNYCKVECNCSTSVGRVDELKFPSVGPTMTSSSRELVQLSTGVSLEVEITPPSSSAHEETKLAVCLHPWSWLGGQSLAFDVASLLEMHLNMQAGWTIRRPIIFHSECFSDRMLECCCL